MPICHLHISHNAPYFPFPPPPPKKKKNLQNLCFSILLYITTVLREIENNAYAKLGAGANKVLYGRCTGGEWTRLYVMHCRVNPVFCMSCITILLLIRVVQGGSMRFLLQKTRWYLVAISFTVSTSQDKLRSARSKTVRR